MSLLEASSIAVHYDGHDEHGRAHRWAAVDGVSLAVAEGERVGIVGESGSGKTTLGKAILGIEPISAGKVFYRGDEVHSMRGKSQEEFRRGAQMIFQDPLGSLNPRMTVGAAISEVLSVHHIVSRSERPAKVRELLGQVGLDTDYIGLYPHEFSGGQRQRIGIARALALNPALLVADEPVSALDVSVQAQILNLLRDLSEQRNMAVLLVAHDLAVVNYVCHRVLIMYKGRVVEEGPTREVFGNPRHPYTQLLKSSVPDPDDIPDLSETPDRVRLGGTPRPTEILEIPQGRAKPPAEPRLSLETVPGCSFAPRCSKVGQLCVTQPPQLKDVSMGHQVACHYS